MLYVSPLKALANDIRLNLEEPLERRARSRARDGLTLAPIRAGLRTGDTPANERAAMLRRPPHILVTTPESLFILLTSARFREKLRAVRYVIVDELHAVAGNKRGAHLALTLERLERMVRACGRLGPTRIGLSATLNPIEEAGRVSGRRRIVERRAARRHARARSGSCAPTTAAREWICRCSRPARNSARSRPIRIGRRCTTDRRADPRASHHPGLHAQPRDGPSGSR